MSFFPRGGETITSPLPVKRGEGADSLPRT